MLPEAVVAILMPLIVFGATALVKKLFAITNGAVIVSVVVPILSLAGAWIATILTPELSYWIFLGLNLISVFVSQVVIQIQKETKSN